MANRTFAASVRRREEWARSAAPRLGPGLNFNAQVARHLGETSVLEGHGGCVNRLAWNEDGSLLASGSDDTSVILWRDPAARVDPFRVFTPHHMNIFGVAILPASGGRHLVSCAMDGLVQHHVLEQPPLATDVSSAPRPRAHARNGGGPGPETAVPALSAKTTTFRCHDHRVKGVATSPTEPDMFWSVSEDGTVRQFDLRRDGPGAPGVREGSAEGAGEMANVLITAPESARTRRRMQFKAMAVNQAHPHMIAVGATDAYVRVYDRRKLAPLPVDEAGGAKPVLCMAPPHMRVHGAGRTHITHASFARGGDRVVATYHGFQAHAFDVRGAGDAAGVAMGAHGGARGAAAQGELPSEAERCKLEGNRMFFAKKHTAAVRWYSRGVEAAPWSVGLRCNRAAALLARKFEGDAMAALKDVEECIAMDPSAPKPRFRRAQALHQIGMLSSSLRALADFADRHPDNETEGVEQLRAAVTRRMRQRTERGTRVQPEHSRRRRARNAPGGTAGIVVHAASDSDTLPARPPHGGPASGSAPGSSNPSMHETSPGGSSREGAAQEDAGEGDGTQEGAVEVHIQVGGAEDEGAVASGGSGGSSISGAGRLMDEDVAHTSTSEDEDEDDDDDASVPTNDDWEGLYDENGRRYTQASYHEEDYCGAGAERRGASPRADRPPDAWETLPDGSPSWAWMFRGRGGQSVRYVGHCNVQTDIKEATFVGPRDELVACGSDDGRVYIYESRSGQLVRTLDADSDVANCVQAHPDLPILATSGIENVVRLWGPRYQCESAGAVGQLDEELDDIVARAQGRSRGELAGAALTAQLARLFEAAPGVMQALLTADRRTSELGDDDDEDAAPVPECRTS
ncbi:unnamed protein product [Pedinophyceae sp. YPF-701]|nr:unnamed protein product [Pedinophyceae sp. YPF-701]